MLPCPLLPAWYQIAAMATILHSCLVRFTAIASILLATVMGNLAHERTNQVSVVRLPTAGQPLKAQVGRDGTIHLLLDSSDGPLYVKSQDGGGNFSEPIAVVDAASQRPGLKFSGSDLAVGREGRVYVAMSN